MRTTSFQEKQVTSYRQKGQGIPLVLLHGFCEDSSMWEDFITALPDQYIIRIDFPGFGKSDYIEGASLFDFSEAVHAVLQEYKVSECIMIGHSMGGYVSLEYAKNHGETLRGLGLFHSHPFTDTEATAANRQRSIDFIEKNGHIYYVKQLIPKLFNANYARSNQLQMDKLILKAVRIQPESIINALNAMRNRSDNSEVLATLTCPLLSIIGEDDELVPANNLEQAGFSAITDLHYLKKVGHMGMFEAKRKCERIVRHFVQAISK